MKSGKWTRLVILAAPLLIGFGAIGFGAGCGDFWQAPTTTPGTCTTNCSTATSGDFYILDAGTTPQIVGDSIVAGALTAISGSPWTLEGAPYSMAIDQAGMAWVLFDTGKLYQVDVATAACQATWPG